MREKKRCVLYCIVVTGIATVGICVVQPFHTSVGTTVHDWSKSPIEAPKVNWPYKPSLTIEDIENHLIDNVLRQQSHMPGSASRISTRDFNSNTHGSSWTETNNGDVNPDSVPHVGKNVAGRKGEKKMLCPELPPGLVGKLPVLYDMRVSDINLTGSQKARIERGGRFSPPDCVPVHETAIIIPYRNRSEHLQMLLAHLHTVLPRQKITYRIYLIEPMPSIVFNRGLLANIGFVMASLDANYTCYIIHDVDKLMADDRNIYRCQNQPTHLMTRMNSDTKLPYENFFGGVEAFTKHQYAKINGFSNLYFGWGGEDDDLLSRVIHSGYSILKPDQEIGAYVSFPHSRDKGNVGNSAEQRNHLFKTTRSRMLKDGLSSLQYKLLGFQEEDLYTRVYVSYNNIQIKQTFSQYFLPE